jgi:hypothetical protein
MELLQNHRYKPGEIPNSYFHEIRLLIESMIDVCQEGEISMYEADCIIQEELLACLDYQDELWKKQYNFENGIDEFPENNGENTSLFSPEELADLNELDKECTKKTLEKALDDMDEYNSFLIEAQDKLDEIFDNADYNKKRKAKIKQQIIRDGLQLSPEAVNTANVQISKISVTERKINSLILRFPKFEKEYPLL